MAKLANSNALASGNPWSLMAPHDHICQVYGSEGAFLDALEGFVDAGFRAGEAVILIATREHLRDLEARVDIEPARAQGRYLAFSAEDTLAQFMVNGWPDAQRFTQVICGVLARARHGGHDVRAFGEMVAILWAKGHYAATVRLEHLWNKLLQVEELPLFCAYPRAGFSRGNLETISELHAAHSRVIGA